MRTCGSSGTVLVSEDDMLHDLILIIDDISGGALAALLATTFGLPAVAFG
jgi:putative lipase involved disintegration of autophagic bodies